MERQKSIEILNRIKAGELPASILKIESGIYKPTDTPGIYQNEGGLKVSYADLKENSKHLSLLVQAVTLQGKEYPHLIEVMPFPVGWIEERIICEIEVIDEETANAVSKLFEP